MKMSALLAAAAYDTAFRIDPLDRFMVLDDIPADMNRRHGIYMLSRGLEPSLDASLALIRKEGSVDYQNWIQRMRKKAEEAGGNGVRKGAIVDHLRFDAWCLVYTRWGTREHEDAA